MGEEQPVDPNAIGLLSRESLIQLERHLIALLNQIWRLTGQNKKVIKLKTHE